MPTSLAMFMPLAKVDVDQRIVHGVATAEKPDRRGEICDYASTKPYFEAWSAEAHEASGGKSLGAVRAMHGRVAAGKLTDINFDDDGKRIIVSAKVVDDDEWEKVLEGVYTGFSQGGHYVARWEDPETGLTRFTADPIEISLVDVPCLPDATFEVVKNGASEFRKFLAKEPETAAAPPPSPHAGALTKAANALSVAIEKLERAIEVSADLSRRFQDISPTIHAIEKRIAALEMQPTTPRAALRAAPRERDGETESAVDSVDSAIKHLASLPEERRALALTKLSLANPIVRRF